MLNRFVIWRIEPGTCSIYMLFIWSILKLVSLQNTLYNRSGLANATKEKRLSFIEISSFV